MNLEIVVGTYDCSIKGYLIDVLEAEEKGLHKKYEEKEHTGCVRAVASGGRYLATGGTDETIKLYNIRKHTEIGTLLQHEGSITWLTFHKESLLLSASEDGTICVWKCGGEWKLLHSLTGHKYAVTCLSVHPSGKLALSVGRDRTLRTWNLPAGRGVFTQRLKKAADLVVWSPIADHYVLTFDSLVVVYQVETGEPVTTIEVNKHVNCVVYVQDSVLAIGSEHPLIQLVSTVSGECVARLEGHTNRVKALSLSPGGELLFSVSSDGTIKAWKIGDPLSASRCISSIDTRSRVTSMALVSPESLLKELKNTTPGEPSLSNSVCEDQEQTEKVLSPPKSPPSNLATPSSESELTESKSHKKTKVSKKASARLTKRMKLKARLSKNKLTASRKTKRLAKH